MYTELTQVWEELTSPGQMFEIVTEQVRGAPVKCFAQAPGSLRDFWLSTAGHGDKDYLVYQQERCSYTQAHEYTASIANWLDLQGVGHGDRVAIAMRNYPEWMLAYWAVVSMGAVVVGMNAWWVPHEMSYALEDSAPKVLICDRERMLRFEEIRTDFPDILVTVVRLAEEVPEWAVDWTEVINAPAQLPEGEIDRDDDVCIFYTSGTTGRPKGAQLTHRGCIANIMNVAFMNTVQPQAVARANGTESEIETALGQVNAIVATPLFHVTANNCVAHIVALAGGKLVHMYKWDPGEALRLVEAEQITTFSAVPMMTREMLMHPDFASRDVSTLKSIGGGGAAMQPDLVAKVDQVMKGAAPATGYGMTEVCGLISGVGGEFFLDKPASVGLPVPTLEVKCVDEHGQKLAAGEIGELWVRGSPVIKGYLNRPEATAESITDGWLHTGDIAYLDEDGFIFLVDRAKDMVLRGGENVYCAEVESAIFAHNDVAECVAFAVPDERLGEEVGAAIYLRPGVTLDAAAIREHSKVLIAPFKVPRYIWFVSEPLPRNASGKFVKKDIKAAMQLHDAS
ncbi:MAG: long-chain acyl-CoA synthetase [Halieaceae bacterium]